MNFFQNSPIISLGIFLFLLILLGCTQSGEQSTVSVESSIPEQKSLLQLEISNPKRHPCDGCDTLDIPFFGVNLLLKGPPIFLNRYDFENRHFSWLIYPNGYRGLVLDGDSLITELPDQEFIEPGSPIVEWGDSSLFFSYSGKRGGYSWQNEDSVRKPYYAHHFIQLKGNQLIHSVFEAPSKPLEKLTREAVKKKGVKLILRDLMNEKTLLIEFENKRAEIRDVLVDTY